MSIESNAHSNSEHGDHSEFGGQDEINIVEIVEIFWREKWLIVIISLSFLMAGVVYAVSLPNIYRASAVLTATESNSPNAIQNLAGQLGGIASIAGLSLGSQSNNTAVVLAVLQSRSFLTKFINDHGLIVPLLAAKSWDAEKGVLILDEKIYDIANKSWRDSAVNGQLSRPSEWDAYDKFSKILKINHDISSGLIIVTIEHKSPQFARNALDLLINDINDFMRDKDVAQSTASINYLEEKLESTPVTKMQTLFYQLIEEQVKKIMLANVRQEYVLTTLDPAALPGEKAKPNRKLICVMAMILGIITAIVIVFVKTRMRPTVK